MKRKSILLAAALGLGLFLATAVFGEDYAATYKRVNPSVVTIRTVELVGDGHRVRQQQALGSGVVVDRRGLIMTAAHVVHTADRIEVEFLDGQRIEAQVVTSNTASDLALIQLSDAAKHPVVAVLGDSDAVEVGQVALVIGAPFGIQHSLSVGFISGRQVRSTLTGGEQLALIQTDAAINHGNSGGPLFNQKGEVVGIVSRILSESGGSDGIGFAVPINLAKKILLEAPSFWTGFEGTMLNEELAEIFNVPQGSGVLIQRVVKGSMADRAGLRGGRYKIGLLGEDIWVGGDIVLSIQGTTCDSPHNFDTIKRRIESLEPGQEIELAVLRAGKTIQLTITKD